MNSDSTRSYKSEIREQQKQQTRKRILEGLIKVMADGIVDVSIPAVADAAELSIPTIYRYFPTKQALFNALPAYLAEKIGAPTLSAQPDLDHYLEMIKAFYTNADNLDATMRAATMSEAAANIRRTTRPERLQMIENMLMPMAIDLPVEDQKRLRNVVLILATSAVMRAFTDYLDLSWQEAADHATWAIQVLVKGISSANNEIGENE